MHLICRKRVEIITGFSRSHIYNEIKYGRFPRQKRYGKRAVRWIEEEVQLWASDPLKWQQSGWSKQ